MAMTLLTTNTSSNAATSSFTSSIDSTYKLFIFKFIDINPATDSAYFQFQANDVDASGYNETMTTTSFQCNHGENDATSFTYRTGTDQAQGTAFQSLSDTIGNGGDESLAGELFLFNPSNTTYVKHWYSTTNFYLENDKSSNHYNAGYFNITAAIDDIQFKMDSGNFDGTIKMYGVA